MMKTLDSINPAAALLRLAGLRGWSMEYIAALEELLQEHLGMSLEPNEASERAVSARQHGESCGIENRYTPKAALGQGGMGQVTRAFDEKLQREVALKQALPCADPARFVHEALLTAQLQHPGIVPIYDLGPEGAPLPSYTMALVEGQTLEQLVVSHHHRSEAPDDNEMRGSGQGRVLAESALHRKISLLRQVGEVLRYAHSRGILHRDLKPANIMVGKFGEVRVVDWGLAKRIRGSEQLEAVDTFRVDKRVFTSINTGMLGSLAYMAPEQARGGMVISEVTDCYALGGCLYFVLTGQPPRDGRAEDILRLMRGPRQAPPPLPSSVPMELAALCRAALSWDMLERPTADTFVEALAAWLDGSHRREQSQRLVQDAVTLRAEIEPLQLRASRLNQEAANILQTLASWDPPAAKEPAWELESQAALALSQAEYLGADALHKLDAALQLEPHHALARDMMADHYRQLHQQALRGGNRLEARRLELLVRAYGAERHAQYLKGEGRLTLYTDPEGAKVELFEYQESARRLLPVPRGILGHTPLIDISLPAGSYLLRLSAEGTHSVAFPIQVTWDETWSGVAPGERLPRAIFLPPIGTLLDDECYVPPGYFQAGEQREPVWIDGFVIKRQPITNAQYIPFLNALVDADADPEWVLEAPRERGANPGSPGVLLYGWDQARRTFTLGQDAEGHQWLPEHPVVMITKWAAAQYCRWLAQREGLPWRLPYELEWEKSARGVDGRLFPWGNHADRALACHLYSRPPGEDATPNPVSEAHFPMDESPYGVRGMAGNVSDWCLDLATWQRPAVRDQRIVPVPRGLLDHPPDPDIQRVLRGGHWYSEPRELPWRFVIGELNRLPSTGFRPVRTLDSIRLDSNGLDSNGLDSNGLDSNLPQKTP